VVEYCKLEQNGKGGIVGFLKL